MKHHHEIDRLRQNETIKFMEYEDLRTLTALNHTKFVATNARALRLAAKNTELLEKLKTLTWKHSDLEQKETKQREELFNLKKEFKDLKMVSDVYQSKLERLTL